MIRLNLQETAAPSTGDSDYNRAQALEDGVLVSASELARRLGFRIPVAITEACWRSCVSWGREDNRRKGLIDNEESRLHAVVLAAARAKDNAKLRRFPGNEITFSVHRIPRPGLFRHRQEVNLSLTLAVEAGAVVGTISLANE